MDGRNTAGEPALRFDDGGWAQAIGNHVALDLVNTVAWRLDAARTVDRLPDGAALVRWAQFVGLLDDQRGGRVRARADRGPGARPTGSRHGVRRAREQLYRVVQPLAVGAEPDAGGRGRAAPTVCSASWVAPRS